MTLDLPTRLIGPLGQADVLRFAGASGDFNPLHWDPAVAAGAGFEAPVAMGQYTAAIMSTWVTDAVGIERLREFEITFVAPVLVGDTLNLQATQTPEALPSGEIRFALAAATARGVVARATAVVAG